MTRAFRLAASVAAALVAGSLLLRLMDPFGVPPPEASDLIPHLWGIGALVVMALTYGWAPTIGWSMTVVGSAASALGVVGLVRELRAADSVAPVLVLGGLAVGALAIPPSIAAWYATWDGRRPAVVAAAWLSVAALVLSLFGGFVARTLDGERGALPEWLWLVTIALLTTLGLVRDLRPAFARTRERLAADGLSGAAGERARPAGRAFSGLRVFLDEVVPGREAGRAEAVESERGRLAADLHAEVLPSLRRALVEAEAGGTVERLAADLRSAVDEVESLLVARRSIVLDEMGLLAALEWLAERVEDRSEVRVEIEVEGEAADGTRPPRDVERAAFRVSQLALDNVVRHAPGARARVRVTVLPASVRLRIEDDGEGPAIDEVAAARGGRRGIADMRAEAHASGASLGLGRGSDGRGVAVEFRWPA